MTFADELHELCKRETSEAIGCPDTSAAMTTELVGALANAIALLTGGQPKASRPLVQGIIETLPQMVFEKPALVRTELQAMRAETNGARA